MNNKDIKLCKTLDKLFVKDNISKRKFTSLFVQIENSRLFLELIVKYQKKLDYGIYPVLKSIDADDLKLRILKNLYEPKVRLEVISSLNDTKKIERYLNEFKDEEDYLAKIAELGDDDFKLKIVRIITTGSYVYSTVSKGFVSRSKAHKALSLIHSIYDKVTFVSSSYDDIFKAEFLLKNKLDNSFINLILLTIADKRLQNTLTQYFYQIKGKNIYYETGFNKEYEMYDAREDVLPKDLRFGVELECVGVASGFIINYNQKPLKRYQVKEEGSLIEGIEITSDILQYNNKDIKSIYEVCDFISQNDLHVDEDCGGHIHYSSTYLDSYASWMMLFYLYSKLERILFLISNDVDSIPRFGIGEFSKPISKIIKKILPNSLGLKPAMN